MQPDPHLPTAATSYPAAPRAAASEHRAVIHYTKAVRGLAHMGLRMISPAFLVVFAAAQMIAGDSELATGAFVVAAVSGALDWSRWRGDILDAEIVGGELHWRTPTAEGTWPVADLKIQYGAIPLMAPRLTRSDGAKMKYLSRGEGRDELVEHIRRHARGPGLSQWSWNRR